MRGSLRPKTSSRRNSSRPPFLVLAVLAIFFIVGALYLALGFRAAPTATEPSRDHDDTRILSAIPAVPVSTTESLSREVEKKSEAVERPVGAGLIQVFVTDRTGLPVSGARVTVEILEASESQAHGFPIEGPSDSSGNVHFTQLPWARYFVAVEHEGQAGFAGASLDAGRPVWNLDIVLKPAASIAGQVVSTEGMPVAEAELSLVDVMANNLKNQTVTSGEDGRFKFTSVPVGLYNLEALAAGYAPALMEKVGIGGPDVKLVMTQGGRISGVVRQAANRAAAPDVAVCVVADAFRDLKLKASSDEKGEFVLENVPAGVLLLSSAEPSHAFSPPETMVKLAADETARVELLMDSGARVSGRVYDSTTDEPVAGALVQATPRGNRTYVWLSKPTDADGRYEITGLTAGPIDVSLARLPRLYGTSVSGTMEQIDLQPGETIEDIDFTVSSGQKLCGVVVNEKDEPVAGAAVSLGDPNSGLGFEDTTSDTDGAFCFINVALPPEGSDPPVLEANFRGARSEPVAVDDTAAAIRLKLLPVPKGVIAGVVVDDSGKPVLASLGLRHPYSDTKFDRRLLRTDADGYFLFQDLSAGDFEIWAAADNGSGFNPGKKLAHSLSLAAGQRVTDLRIVLTNAGTVTGVLKDAKGVPLPHVSVEVWDLDLRDYAAGTFTDREGRFNITGLEGTNLELRPEDDSTGGYWSVPVKPGDDVDLTLTSDMFGNERPPEPVYLIDRETGEEIVTTQDELPTVLAPNDALN
jgi:protocatechuate 3,4-dioxygenase beta subunit